MVQTRKLQTCYQVPNDHSVQFSKFYYNAMILM